MYTCRNFKTKKALKEAVAAYNAALATGPFENALARAVEYYQPGPFASNCPQNGTIYCEGPHYPEPHKWYARCEAKDGKIIKVS